MMPSSMVNDYSWSLRSTLMKMSMYSTINSNCWTCIVIVSYREANAPPLKLTQLYRTLSNYSVNLPANSTLYFLLILVNLTSIIDISFHFINCWHWAGNNVNWRSVIELNWCGLRDLHVLHVITRQRGTKRRATRRRRRRRRRRIKSVWPAFVRRRKPRQKKCETDHSCCGKMNKLTGTV